MIACNVFDADVKLEDDGFLSIELLTDLPCGTQVILDVYRTYLDFDNEECEWLLHSVTHVIEVAGQGDFNGFIFRLSLDRADETALEEFNEEIGEYSRGIKSTVSDKVNISFVVGGRQRLKAFGRGNTNLSGSQVVDSSGIRVVEKVLCQEIPLKSDCQPYRQ